MNFKMILSMMLAMIVLFMSGVVLASDAVLTISSAGNGVFTLQGTGFSDVAGMDVAISYDTATLANPKVVQGTLISGTMMLSNTKSPGMVRIAMVTTRSISGSGPVATINFDRPGTSGGRVLALTARLVDSKGAPLPVATQVSNPVDANSSAASSDVATDATTASTQADTVSQSTETSSGTSVNTSSRYVGSSTINVAAETVDVASGNTSRSNFPEQHTADAGAEQSTEPTGGTGPANQRPPAQKSRPARNGYVAYKSVLDVFREFRGERTPKSLTALFAESPMPGVRQEPAVALTDGRTRVKTHIRLDSTQKGTVNFSLKGARLISLKTEGDSWVVEVLPNRNVSRASIKALCDGSVMEIPLTVAQPVAADGKLVGNSGNGKSSSRLTERSGERIPRFDLNGDGLKNYVDDYIFAANYIVRNSNKIR